MSRPDRKQLESSESEGDVEHNREELEFLLYREKIRKHNKDRLKTRQQARTPFNLNSNSSYGALELSFANNKSVSRRIWRKKNIYLAMQNSSGPAEPDIASTVEPEQEDVPLHGDGDGDAQASEAGDGADVAQAPQVVDDASSSIFQTIWNGCRDFLRDFYDGAWEVLSGNWDYAD